ncbi:MAG: hypothetical protein ACKVU4_07580 [Phycisphaerales bacterium]
MHDRTLGHRALQLALGVTVGASFAACNGLSWPSVAVAALLVGVAAFVLGDGLWIGLGNLVRDLTGR